jgi:hypothetical protein
MGFRPAGPGSPDLIDATRLKLQATSNLGLPEFGDDPFAQNFANLVDALNTDGELSEQGVQLSEEEILRLLRNRLELRGWLTGHPEILDEPIVQPIFLMGLPRSGTTFLQNLFDQDDGLRLLRTWETLRPCPPPAVEPDSVTPRIKAADRFLNRWRGDVENFDATHLMDVTGPDECAHIMSMAFTQAGFQNYAKVPSYFDWLLREADFQAAYRLHKTVLQLLQWRAPVRRWVLKYPNHMLAVGEIRAVYPDAACVVTHRDPVQTLASLCALTEQYRAARYDTNDRVTLGREMLEFVRAHIDRFMVYRGGAGDAGIIDVDYYRLLADPISTVADIYDRTGMVMPDTVRDRLAVWTDANPKGHRGRHEYRLADYGLDAGELDTVFTDYRRRFGVRSEIS